VEATGEGGRICLLGLGGTVLGCGEASAEEGDDADALATRLVVAFHDEVFAPRVDMSQADANSLDGSNRTAPDAMGDLLGSPDDY